MSVSVFGITTMENDKTLLLNDDDNDDSLDWSSLFGNDNIVKSEPEPVQQVKPVLKRQNAIIDSGVRKRKLKPSLFLPKQLFRNYNMHFLQTPVQISLDDPVSLNATKYRYHVKQLSGENIAKLTTALRSVDRDLKLNEKALQQQSVFLPAEKTKLLDFIGREISYAPDDVQCRLNVELQGYKEKDGVKSPIWRLGEAHFNYK